MLLTYQNCKQILLKIVSRISNYKQQEGIDLAVECLFYFDKRKTRPLLRKLSELSNFLLKQGDILNTKRALQIELFVKVVGLEDIEQLTSRSANVLSIVESDRPKVNLFTTDGNQRILFKYRVNSYFNLNNINYYDKADLAAIVLLTLYYYQNEPISRRDIERLSQRFISYFPSLKNSNDWETKYGHKTPFNCFSTKLMKELVTINVISFSPEKVANSKLTPRRYKLTELGLKTVRTLAESLNFDTAMSA